MRKWAWTGHPGSDSCVLQPTATQRHGRPCDAVMPACEHAALVVGTAPQLRTGSAAAAACPSLVADAHWLAHPALEMHTGWHTPHCPALPLTRQDGVHNVLGQELEGQEQRQQDHGAHDGELHGVLHTGSTQAGARAAAQGDEGQQAAAAGTRSMGYDCGVLKVGTMQGGAILKPLVPHLLSHRLWRRLRLDGAPAAHKHLGAVDARGRERIERVEREHRQESRATSGSTAPPHFSDRLSFACLTVRTAVITMLALVGTGSTRGANASAASAACASGACSTGCCAVGLMARPPGGTPC